MQCARSLVMCVRACAPCVYMAVVLGYYICCATLNGLGNRQPYSQDCMRKIEIIFIYCT